MRARKKQAPRRKPIARANLSIYFDSLQGRLGRATFTKTKFGTIIRESADAAQPNTDAQRAVKTRFSLAAADWNALTAPQKAAWVAYGAAQRRTEPATRATYARTGYNAYTALALVWLAANGDAGSPPVAPPAAPYFGDAVVVSAQAALHAVTFTAVGETGPDTVVQIELQRLANPSRKPSRNGYRIVGYATFTKEDLTVSFAVAPGAYAARYPFVEKTTGQRTAFRDIPVTGVVS